MTTTHETETIKRLRRFATGTTVYVQVQLVWWDEFCGKNVELQLGKSCLRVTLLIPIFEQDVHIVIDSRIDQAINQFVEKAGLIHTSNSDRYVIG